MCLLNMQLVDEQHTRCSERLTPLRVGSLESSSNKRWRQVHPEEAALH